MSHRLPSTVIKARHYPAPARPGMPTPVIVTAGGVLRSAAEDQSVDDLLAEADTLVEEAERLSALQLGRARLASIDALCAQVDSLFDD